MHIDIICVHIEYPISNIEFNMNINISYHPYVYVRVFFHFNLNLISYGPSVSDHVSRNDKAAFTSGRRTVMLVPMVVWWRNLAYYMLYTSTCTTRNCRYS